MSRTLSLTMRAAMNGQETGEVAVVLLTIAHEDLADGPIRLSSDPSVRLSTEPLLYGTQSRGSDYIFLPMSVTLPDDQEDAPPAAQVTIDNIDRSMIELIRSTSTPASVKLEMVLASAPDHVEIDFPALDLVAAEYDAQGLTLTLTNETLQAEPYPAGSFDPSTFPGLF